MGLILDPFRNFAPTEIGDRVTVSSGPMALVLGVPTRGLVARTSVWLMDAVGTEIVGGITNIPTHWRTLHADLLWCSTTTEVGGVAWRFDLSAVTVGAAAPDPVAGTQVIGTAAANTGVVQTRVATNLAAPDGVSAFEVIRLGGDVGDTLTVDAGVIGLILSKAS